MFLVSFSPCYSVSFAHLALAVLCYIQGNLKEYCCYKVDKRIGELLRHRQRIRVRRQLAMEKQVNEAGVLKDRNGKVVGTLAQPTLPIVDFMDHDDDMRMQHRPTGRRKSIARFARSVSKKVKRPGLASGTVADEAGVGLPPTTGEWSDSRFLIKG
jgi:hypothetical protein